MDRRIRFRGEKIISLLANGALAALPVARAAQPAAPAAPAERVSVLVHLEPGVDRAPVRQFAAAHAAAGRDFVNGDNNPEDDNGHGSHVSGSVLGGTGLSVNFGCVGSAPFQGIAPEATLIGIKVPHPRTERDVPRRRR